MRREGITYAASEPIVGCHPGPARWTASSPSCQSDAITISGYGRNRLGHQRGGLIVWMKS
jgi:hypothetical protein